MPETYSTKDVAAELKLTLKGVDSLPVEERRAVFSWLASVAADVLNDPQSFGEFQVIKFNPTSVK